jgi:predicted Ser/Thr protein kinase
MPDADDRNTVTQPGSLTPERFARVRAIFEAALERPAAERRAFAAGACVGDAALLREVEAMLAAEARSDPLLPRERPPSSSAPEEGRFPSGTILGERYRILGLLGRGGMGEVYRAFDLKLDQTVALKFLPAAANNNTRLLERFRGEVRVARQVSHRNVCRVHDIGEADGLAFISMEYIDGDNLATLLKQIGRLPADKALEFARKLCAGLSAAHEKGVLHRDLKPANIMIDRRGQIVIMDFGLAAAADAIPGADIRSGTPAYMAPEQKEGKEVTTRSDIYSLGLVLAEMFTGQKDTKTTTVKDLDPAVEKVIQRCLDPNPRNRPDSALTVARMLPGGDPLAEALAAGDTPTPAMVAASDDTGALSVRAAIACLLFVLVGVVPSLWVTSRASILRGIPLPDPPLILARKAHDIAVKLGYTAPPADSAWGFRGHEDFTAYARANLKTEDYRDLAARGQPPAILFWYRQSPASLLPNSPGRVWVDDPPLTQPQTVRIETDPEGRLVYFDAVPTEDMPAGSIRQVDWKALFEAAGLPPEQWTPVTPRRVPRVAFDEQAAWTGAYAHAPSVPLRIEAAAWKGRPVHFEVNGPWGAPAAPLLPRVSGFQYMVARLPVVTVVVAAFIVVVVVLAWRNYQRGRADLDGALRLAGFALSVHMGAWMLTAHYVADVRMLEQLQAALRSGLYASAYFWAAYVMLEPYVRRRWPQSMISWMRLLGGKLRDPLVAGHFLLGLALAVGFRLIAAAGDTTQPLGGTNPASILALSSPIRALGGWAGGIEVGMALQFTLFAVIFLLRVILRRTWLAVAIMAVVPGLARFRAPDGPLAGAAITTLLFVVVLAVLIRFGVLPMIVTYVFDQGVLERSAFPDNLTSWYAPGMYLAVAVIAALALWTFRNALGGRKVWKTELLET